MEKGNKSATAKKASPTNQNMAKYRPFLPNRTVNSCKQSQQKIYTKSKPAHSTSIKGATVHNSKPKSQLIVQLKQQALYLRRERNAGQGLERQKPNSRSGSDNTLYVNKRSISTKNNNNNK